MQVEARVKGRIDQRWSEWLDDLTIAHTDQDETVLTGEVTDQAALYGLGRQTAGPGVAALVGQLRGGTIMFHFLEWLLPQTMEGIIVGGVVPGSGALDSVDMSAWYEG